MVCSSTVSKHIWTRLEKYLYYNQYFDILLMTDVYQYVTYNGNIMEHLPG